MCGTFGLVYKVVLREPSFLLSLVFFLEPKVVASPPLCTQRALLLTLVLAFVPCLLSACFVSSLPSRLPSRAHTILTGLLLTR